MAEIQIEIQGSGAVPATKELFSIPGISGDWSSATDAPQREGILVTIATIVAITTGAITVAEKIYQWYQNSRRNGSKNIIEKAILIGRNGDRILLKDATVDQIRQILEAE